MDEHHNDSAPEFVEQPATTNESLDIPSDESEAALVEEQGDELEQDDLDEPSGRWDMTRRTRIMGGLALGSLAAAGALLLLINTVSGGDGSTAQTTKSIDPDRCPGITPSALVLSRLTVRDTVYTTDKAYLEINLSTQTVTVHHRDGKANTFLISSGNRFISEGISTPTGFFTVQNKTPMAISHQFHDAKLYNWIGVQGGVGFHALAGSGYYWNLGKRPSSHGCIRMSHEQVAQMYSMVEPGMPIISHYGSPARVVAFCDEDDTVGAVLIDSANVYNKQLGKPRMQTLLDGNYWVAPKPRLVHLKGQRVRWGMECPEAKNIPAQHLPKGPSIRDVITRTVSFAQADRVSTAGYSGRLFEELRKSDSTLRLQHDAEDKQLSQQTIRE